MSRKTREAASEISRNGGLSFIYGGPLVKCDRMRSRNEGPAREYLARRFFCANAMYAFRMCVSTSECKYALSEHVGSQNVARSSWHDMQNELITSDIWLRRDFTDKQGKKNGI